MEQVRLGNTGPEGPAAVPRLYDLRLAEVAAMGAGRGAVSALEVDDEVKALEANYQPKPVLDHA